MTFSEFYEISKLAFETFKEKMHEWHRDKPEESQYLIRLNTDLPFSDKLTYELPIEMLRMEDTSEKTRSIILWRIFQHQTDIETLRKIADVIDENIKVLRQGNGS
jgi:hypothetical protein